MHLVAREIRTRSFSDSALRRTCVVLLLWSSWSSSRLLCKTATANGFQPLFDCGLSPQVPDRFGCPIERSDQITTTKWNDIRYTHIAKQGIPILTTQILNSCTAYSANIFRTK